MNVKTYRLLKPKHASEAFSGEGARRYGGRWNNKGVPIVYLASSLSLAALELLVHLESEQILSEYTSIAVEFDSEQMLILPENQYPQDWQDYPAPSSTKRIGDAWFQSKDSLILQVKSVVISEEFIYLLNPLHSDFADFSIAGPKPFNYDGRLAK